MSTIAAQIESQALALPVEERAHIAGKLWDSLYESESPPLSTAWAEEIERRRAEISHGKAVPVRGEEVSEKAMALAKSAAQ
jgi:putative addiction module component (TIGR02574 family)